MIGLILTVIGYVLAIAWIAWRIIRIPAIDIREQDNRSLLDLTFAEGVLLLGLIAPHMGHTTSETRGAAFLLIFIGLVIELIVFASDNRFTHTNK